MHKQKQETRIEYAYFILFIWFKGKKRKEGKWMLCFLLRVNNGHRVLYASWNSCKYAMEEHDDIAISRLVVRLIAQIYYWGMMTDLARLRERIPMGDSHIVCVGRIEWWYLCWNQTVGVDSYDDNKNSTQVLAQLTMTWGWWGVRVGESTVFVWEEEGGSGVIISTGYINI